MPSTAEARPGFRVPIAQLSDLNALYAVRCALNLTENEAIRQRRRLLELGLSMNHPMCDTLDAVVHTLAACRADINQAFLEQARLPREGLTHPQ